MRSIRGWIGSSLRGSIGRSYTPPRPYSYPREASYLPYPWPSILTCQLLWASPACLPADRWRAIKYVYLSQDVHVLICQCQRQVVACLRGNQKSNTNPGISSSCTLAGIHTRYQFYSFLHAFIDSFVSSSIACC